MKPLRLYNTLSRTVEEFKPQEPIVRMYTCGPTVYDYQHIGNYRTFIFEDILVKTLQRFGYTVDRVMNITDVGHLTSDQDEGEDKLEVGAKREGLSAWEIAKKYEQAFLEDMELLNLEKPNKLIRATETVEQQIEFIEELEKKGYTYTREEGVYFDSSKVKDYGKLAHLDIAGLEAGARVEMGHKKHPTDFALWKLSPPGTKRQMEWESPWGVGFPGWHIECSAIIRYALGDTIDIHCGGVDHIPVHHTNEIAQSESANRRPLSHFWCHSEFLLINGGKMSKSLGNVYTLADLVARGYDPLAFRLLTYSASYRSKLNFTWDSLDDAAAGLEKLRALYQMTSTENTTPVVQQYLERLDAALADDLNMAVVMAVVWEVAHGELSPEEKRAFLSSADQLLSLSLNKSSESTEELPEAVTELIEKRKAARAAHDWALSDQLRMHIAQLGYEVSDTPEGQLIKKKKITPVAEKY